MVERYFVQYAIVDQDILGNHKTVDKVLALVPEDILLKCHLINVNPTNNKVLGKCMCVDCRLSGLFSHPSHFNVLDMAVFLSLFLGLWQQNVCVV